MKRMFLNTGGNVSKTTYEKQNLNNKEHNQSHLSTMMFWFVFKVSRFVEDIRQNKTHNQVDTLRNSVRVFFSFVQSREIDLTRATSKGTEVERKFHRKQKSLLPSVFTASKSSFPCVPLIQTVTTHTKSNFN